MPDRVLHTKPRVPGDSPQIFFRYRNEDWNSRGEFNLRGVLGGLGGLNTQDCASLGLRSEFTFPLVEGRRRAVDRPAELRDGSIGSFALGDTFGPNFGGFR